MLRILAGMAFLFCTVTYGQSPLTSANPGCFRTEIVEAKVVSDHCTYYKFKVSFEGDCRHALSHYTVAIPCGKVSNIRNSENWKIVVGKDPKTGLKGFKIDDIPGFGDTSLKYFYVSFTLCAEDSNCREEENTECAETLKCWEPIVAYKAGTKIYYDTLDANCEELKASIRSKVATCYGGNDGALEVIVEEGTEPYSYAWSNGTTLPSLLNVVAGTYTVTITDASGETLQLTGTVGQPEQIFLSAVVTHASCNGLADGAIDLTVEGGTGGYTFVWSNGATTEDLTALKEGTYMVTVTDSAGCTSKKTVAVTSTSKIVLSSTTVPAGCNQSNGSINLTVSGGTEPYTFVWSNGSASEDISGLPAGVYKVKVTDSIGCSSELVVNLKDNNTLRLAGIMQQTSCVDDASGAINVTVSGGAPPYTFVWSNGATTEDLDQLVAGVYKLTVTDANGCTASITVNVSKKTFQVSSQITHPLCFGDTTGSITLTPSGGTEPYTYEWSNGETGNSITGSSGGVYQVTITDATGCSKVMSYSVVKPTRIIASVSVAGNTCSGAGSSVDLSVNGGKPSYSYEWSTGDTSQDVDSLANGEYWVKITDANGCQIVKELIVESSAPTWSCLINQPDSAAVCGSNGNTLATSVEGATYSWTVTSSDSQWAITSGATSSQIQYTAGGENSTATFTLTITKDGCVQTCSYTTATCVTDPDGGGDPGGGDPGNGGESCEDCFSSSIVTIPSVSTTSTGNCTTYEVTVSTNGECRHDLSHWDIAIPCGTITNMWNSEGWKMVIGKDPTTGLYGLKVDDIDGFGGEEATFTVKFTLCTESSHCEDKLEDWDPVVAYKAGQCIAYDTLSLSGNNGGGSDGDDDDDEVCAYPNPVKDRVCFKWVSERDENLCIDLIDKNGRKVKGVYDGSVRKGETYKFDCDVSNLSNDLYIYRCNAGGRVKYGKLFKK